MSSRPKSFQRGSSSISESYPRSQWLEHMESSPFSRAEPFSTTSQIFDAAYWRAKEGELARTILASPAVASENMRRFKVMAEKQAAALNQAQEVSTSN